MRLPSILRHVGSHGPRAAAPALTAAEFQWLPTGAKALAEMLKAIAEAGTTIRLEMYTIEPDRLGEKFRAALIAAAERGVAVRVLADGVGSYSMGLAFWRPLTEAGGEFRHFKVPGLGRFGLRDHRKLLVCDDYRAIVGGVNIGPDYDGDGVDSGWRDLAVQFQGTMARELGAGFDQMFALAGFKRPRFGWLRHAVRQRRIQAGHATVLLTAPGWRRNPLVHSITHDFQHAKSIRIMMAYFLPTGRLLRALRGAARRGAKVQIILAEHSDMPLTRMAARSLYYRLLKSGVEIYEYLPQILHAKLMIVDGHVVYAGSANLDVRGLRLNYELSLRVENKQLAEEAGKLYEADLAHCQRIELAAWMKTRHWWRRLLDRCAYWLHAHFDPFVASHSWRR
jgi:cardiolipin synthase A/B